MGGRYRYRAPQHLLERDAKQEEAARKETLRREREAEEQRLRVMRSIKI